MPARHPSREDRALWRKIMHDVKPLVPARTRRSPEKTEREIESAPEPRAHRLVRVPVKGATRSPSLAPGKSPGVDRRTSDRFRRGQLAVEARIDLHGMTQEEAHRALASFIYGSKDDGLRVVLVITGKGGFGDARGVLREAVPRWLNEAHLRPCVLACAWAQPRHGGTGALYVLLRRQR